MMSKCYVQFLHFPPLFFLFAIRLPDVNHSVIISFWPAGNWEPRNEVGSLSPVERLVGFEAETLRFDHHASIH